ncbi:unnamed protein product, partial [Heterosigma akashiwo]
VGGGGHPQLAVRDLHVPHVRAEHLAAGRGGEHAGPPDRRRPLRRDPPVPAAPAAGRDLGGGAGLLPGPVLEAGRRRQLHGVLGLGGRPGPVPARRGLCARRAAHGVHRVPEEGPDPRGGVHRVPGDPDPAAGPPGVGVAPGGLHGGLRGPAAGQPGRHPRPHPARAFHGGPAGRRLRPG